MKILSTAMIASMALLLPKCNTFESPLATEGEKPPAISETLVGDWKLDEKIEGISRDEQPVFRIERSETPGLYQLSFVSQTTGIPELPPFRVVEIQENLFIDASQHPSGGHFIVNLMIKNDRQLQIRTLQADQVAENESLRAERKRLYLDPKMGFSIPVPLSLIDCGVSVTATTAELREFLSDDLDDACFGEPLSLTKVTPETHKRKP